MIKNILSILVISADISNEIFSGLIGAIIGGVLTGVTTFLTLRFNYNQLYAQTVSQNRMEWINVWRENVSEFLAIAEEIHLVGSISQEQGIRYNAAQNMVLARLNMSEELHRLMFQAVNALDCTPTNARFHAEKEYIMELMRLILKPEWERVKQEASGERR